jgi:hypothetical protein
MIRGAIENVTRNRVFGWLWSPDVTLLGRTVLAFLDDVCIGAGKIEGFRQDLKDAGLGDGQAGFNFDLTYPNPADAPRVTVKLEGSDVVLVQRRSRIMPPGAGASAAARTTRQGPSLTSLQWMRARGWLTQSDYDFLRFFRQLGVYERSLVVPQERPERADAQLLDPGETARGMLMLHRMEEAELRREALAAPQLGGAAGSGCRAGRHDCGLVAQPRPHPGGGGLASAGLARCPGCRAAGRCGLCRRAGPAVVPGWPLRPRRRRRLPARGSRRFRPRQLKARRGAVQPSPSA